MKFTVFLSIILFSLSVIAAPTLLTDGAISIQAVSIGDSAAADSKSLLDIKSTTKGILFPRMTTTQMNAIASPTTGLMVWNTTLANLYQYNGSAWVAAGTLSPLTTKGDVWVYGSANDRLPVGTNNYTIIADSAQSLGVKWGQLSLTAGVTGTLPIANGGTGQTTANAALNGFLPTQTGNAAKFLKTDGTNSSWADAFTLSTFGTVASPRLLAVATGITSGAGHMSTTAPMQIVIIKNTNSYYEAVTANPQIEAGTILGQQMRVVWASSSAIVSFATGNGIDLNGSWWPVNGSTLDLYWNGSVWSEYTRSDR